MKHNLKELILTREEELMIKNYSFHSTKILKKYWNEFLKFCEESNVNYLNIDLANLFLNNYDCNINDTYNLNFKQKKAILSLKVLFDINNITLTLNSRKNIQVNDYYSNKVDEYLMYCKNIKNNSETTLEEKEKYTKLFFKYLIENEISKLEYINKEIIKKYINLNNNEINSKRIAIFWNLRNYLIYLESENIIDNNYSILFPVINRNYNRKLPSVFEKDDAEKIIEYLKLQLDKTPASYRNFSIILIAYKLGIRKIDIINLKWNEIDWKNNTIRLIQKKTGKELIIPFSADVGESIINYIKKERPFKIKNDNEYIFIRHRFPFEKLSNKNNFNDIISKAFDFYNIPNDKYKKRGLHSFRFRLATELLNNEVPVDIISTILGHSNTNSTNTYLSVNEKKLRLCFIEDEDENE